MPEAEEDQKIPAEISVYELLGAEVFLYVEVEKASFTARVNPDTSVRTGSKLKFLLDMKKAHFFDKETEVSIL